MLKTLTIPSVEEGWSTWNHPTSLMGMQNGRATQKIWQYFKKLNIHLQYDHS